MNPVIGVPSKRETFRSLEPNEIGRIIKTPVDAENQRW